MDESKFRGLWEKTLLPMDAAKGHDTPAPPALSMLVGKVKGDVIILGDVPKDVLQMLLRRRAR